MQLICVHKPVVACGTILLSDDENERSKVFTIPDLKEPGNGILNQVNIHPVTVRLCQSCWEKLIAGINKLGTEKTADILVKEDKSVSTLPLIGDE
jgi:hypothetical protein